MKLHVQNNHQEFKVVDIPAELIEKWQSVVNLVGDSMQVPAAMIMKKETPDLKVVVASNTNENPYHRGGKASLNTGIYCETVMATRMPLLVPDARADIIWESNPDLKFGMTSYLGFPIAWPDGEIFGTICVLDVKKNAYDEIHKRLLQQFSLMIETDLRILSNFDAQVALHLKKQLKLEQDRSDAVIKSASRINKLIQYSLDAVVAMDADGIVKSWNPQAEKIFNWTKEEALGQRLLDLITPLQYKEVLQKSIDEFLLLEKGSIFNKRMELKAMGRGNKEFPVELTIIPLEGDQHSWEFFFFARDISGEKKIEQQQSKIIEQEHNAREAAENASRLKSKFLDIAAHELRTPITAFSLLLQITQRALDRGQPVEANTLVRLRYQANRIARLVVDLLDVSRLERGLVVLQPVPTNIVSLISECIKEFQMLEPDRVFNFFNQDNDDVIEINLDPVRINQVLTNLLDNAVKYTPKESAVDISLIKQPHSVRVSVVDHGVGIPPQQQKDLFVPFTRGMSDQVMTSAGLGLGLFICRGIIEIHKGTIGVVSEVGKGSTFYFELPRDTRQE